MAATEGTPVKPPRPPNSWILYRAYMMKKLQPKDPRERRLSQSEMSSLIASMWRNAKPETKREFEEMAERIKLEHSVKYPGYKYQPRKKEEKERAKELQKQQRQAQKRDSRSKRGVSATSASVPAPPPIAPYYNPHLMLPYYSALSPPLSAASSPSPIPVPPSPAPLPELPQVQAPPPLQRAPETYLPSPLPTPLDPATYLPLPVPTDATPQNSGPLWQSPIDHDSSSNTCAIDFNNWLYDSDTNMTSFLSTAVPGLFEIENFNKVRIDQNPEFEVAFSDANTDVSNFLRHAFHEKDLMPAPYIEPTSDIDAFDFSSLLNPYLLEPSNDASFGLFDSYGQSSSYLEQQPFSPIDPSASRSTSETFANLAALIPSESLTTVVPQTYLPPTGAAHSSTRRVAGKWTLPAFISASSQG